ncbi:GntR family transcriptional regulator [Synergistaceae bacterium OttesenSCG-928-D05]|nr:GntR family transcriptional regulator [Synergistaceae bacterium OttesenSCG-928-D05]
MIAHPTLQEIAYDLIKEKILYGKILPGERINLEKCATEFGISATPLREAMTKLQQEGLAFYIPRAGWRVPKLSREDFLKQRELQIILETALAERALPFIDAERIALLRESNGRMRDAIETMPREELGHFLQEENDRFHLLIFTAYDNDVMLRVLQNTWDTIKYQRTVMAGTEHFFKICVPDHEYIIECLEKKDLTALKHSLELHFENGPLCLEECFENFSDNTFP